MVRDHMARILPFPARGKSAQAQLTNEIFAEDGGLSFQEGPERPDTSATGDWSNQELADLYRVEALFAQANIRIETDRGVSDEGEPWFAFCRSAHDVFVHLARIDGVYLLDSPALDTVITGDNFAAIIDRFVEVMNARSSAGNIVQLRPGMRDSVVRMHPAVMLAALIWSLYLATDGHDSAAQTAQPLELPTDESAIDIVLAAVSDTQDDDQQASGQEPTDRIADRVIDPPRLLTGIDDRNTWHNTAAGAASIAASLTAIAVTYGFYSPALMPVSGAIANALQHQDSDLDLVTHDDRLASREQAEISYTDAAGSSSVAQPMTSGSALAPQLGGVSVNSFDVRIPVITEPGAAGIWTAPPAVVYGEASAPAHEMQVLAALPQKNEAEAKAAEDVPVKSVEDSPKTTPVETIAKPVPAPVEAKTKPAEPAAATTIASTGGGSGTQTTTASEVQSQSVTEAPAKAAATKVAPAAPSDAQSLVKQAAVHLGSTDTYKIGDLAVSATFDVSKLSSHATDIVLAQALTDSDSVDTEKLVTGEIKTPHAGPETTPSTAPRDTTPATETVVKDQIETPQAGKTGTLPTPAPTEATVITPVKTDPAKTDTEISTGTEKSPTGSKVIKAPTDNYIPSWLGNYDDAARKFVYHFLTKSPSIEMIQVDKSIIFVDTTAIDEPTDIAYAHSWVLDGEFMVSTIGHRQDFVDYGLI